jgi:5,6-dimethylbenzimidazole synthase
MSASDLPLTPEQRSGVYRAIAERRDMRHFRDAPVAPEVLARLLQAAHHAPSVGLMQPWRFIRINDRDLRRQLHALVDAERRATAQALGEREQEFMRLKVEGILDCGELLVAALMDRREAHVFGRRTLPQMDLASVACAIQNLWLAAYAEGLGMGWVSLFEPEPLRALLHMPAGSEPVAILCLGHVDAFYPAPMLQLDNWAQPAPLSAFVMENRWSDDRVAPEARSDG